DFALCDEAEAFFEEAFADAREITLDDWRQRPAMHRLREWLFGYMDLMIERFGMNREIRRKGPDSLSGH
ncbi:MAG: hypothetical protein Q9M30_05860, partial [Mariprofundaceae bacterium]|nr:hypothetical protein [Mariprofundaceae bacterium]